MTRSLSPNAPVPTAWVDKLFEQLAAAYGNKFLDMWAGQNMQTVKGLWAARMGALSPDELQAGVRAAIEGGRTWPPTLPEFIAMCRVDIDPDKAFYEALYGLQARKLGERGTWSHRAVYWAAVKIGLFDFENMSYAILKPRWEQALTEALARNDLPEVPEPAIALPAPGQAFTTKEEAQKRLAELRLVLKKMP